MDHPTTLKIWLLHCWWEAEPLPFYFHSPRMCMVVCFRENVPVSILVTDNKRSFWVAWTVHLAMCLAERESAIHQFPSVRSNSWTTDPHGAGPAAFARCGGYEKALDFTRAGHRIVQSMLLLSLFCSTEGIHARTFLWRTHRNEIEQDTCTLIVLSRHNGCHVASWVHDIEEGKGEPLLALCFGIARVLDHLLWFLSMLTSKLLNSMAARAPSRRPTHVCADED